MAATNTTATAAPAAEDTVTATGSAAAVWDAVTANPGATIATIAKAAGVTRAVAKNELAALASAGQVTCTPGSVGANGRRQADTWAPAVPVAGATTGDPITGGAAADTGDGAARAAAPTGGTAAPAMSAEMIENAMRIMAQEAERRAAAEAELQAKIAEEEARRARVMAELAKARTAEATRRALTGLLAAVTETYAAVVAGDDAATAAGLERIYAETGNVRRASRVTPVRTTGTGTRNGTVSGAGRAAPRPLRPEVLAHLCRHPETDFTPGEIAKVLERSSGAVANALDTLVKKGEAVLTNDRPARYRAAAPAATGGAGEGASADATADAGTGSGPEIGPEGG
ncbi:hypothetical protein Acsp04_65000 [Actinomadura sp. NBRC 104425]|uniref:MarR family transcriptional regulator n=1 Tax=Actinomadura sp. NBRC 104425 TaxID=3032204 RepID=UPI0024A01A48|nr:helix-turn-helix domain-containing protein [Actinomadura sp. NBRC 104425]GLZ16265.1 hypothetical protein Acsp04_65000 [Actinomadura sp. NBRC 104425]